MSPSLILQTFPSLRYAQTLGELTLWCECKDLTQVATFLKKESNLLFEQLMDVCGVDYPGRTPRFDVVYHFLSLRFNQRIRLIVETDTAVPSLVPLFPSAGWWERETFDMFGILFEGHPDLRRILTDYGFDGYPLRKDFPLTGYLEVRYDEEKGEVIQEPVQLTQAYRRFDFESPWEGMKNLFDEPQPSKKQ